MISFFITKQNDYDSVMPVAGPTGDPNVDLTKLEPGTMQELLPGEDVKSPVVPETSDYSNFMQTELRRFAAAVGITYEMLTGDYSKVNYSSARVALLEFRRQAEQFQTQILVDQFCQPVLEKWMNEAVLCGALELPDDYVKDPTVYSACTWIPDGYQWVDPLKEVQAAMTAVRAGFTSRSMVIRQNGFDPEIVDGQIAEERKREQALGIVMDTNSNQVLIGRETQPLTITQAQPNEQSDKEAAEGDEDEDQ
jgi:lambda family phage portal protein